MAYRYSEGFNQDRQKAEADVHSVYKEYAKASGENLYGYPKVIEIMPKVVVDKVLELLGIERPDFGYNLTDAGNGRRLVDEHKDEIRYCVDDERWYVWDGVRWRKDVIQNVRELAKGIAADIRQEAEIMKPPAATGNVDVDVEARTQYERRKRELLKWANQSENVDRVTKRIRSAESDPRVMCFRSDFDQHANLLNCPNCIVDVYTGKTMPHDRKLMLSNLCPVEYDPAATHPVWEESLAGVNAQIARAHV